MRATRESISLKPELSTRATKLRYPLTSREDDEGVSKFHNRPRVLHRDLKHTNTLLASLTSRGNTSES